MCTFFSFVTEPEGNGGKRFYFDWEQRSIRLSDALDSIDSHSSICSEYSLDEDKCNKYEYNPLTHKFKIDKISSVVDDKAQAEEWVTQLDFKRIIPALIIKPIINSFDLPEVTTITEYHKQLLREWVSVSASVRASVGASVRASVSASVEDSVGASVGASVRASVRASVGDSVEDSVGASVGASIWDSIGAYASSFFDIPYKHDFTSCIRLWEQGLVPSFDGTIWRLHSGKNANVVYEVEGV
jgi:hypothetical protein